MFPMGKTVDSVTNILLNGITYKIIIRRDIFETKKCQQKQNAHIRKEMNMADTENLILRNVSRPNLKDSPIILEKIGFHLNP